MHWIDRASLELLTIMVDRVPHLARHVVDHVRGQNSVPPWHKPRACDDRPTRHASASAAGWALIQRVTGGKALPGKPSWINSGAAPTACRFSSRNSPKRFWRAVSYGNRTTATSLISRLQSLAIPTTLQASLTARLDRLAPVRDVAQIGAVGGPAIFL